MLTQHGLQAALLNERIAAMQQQVHGCQEREEEKVKEVATLRALVQTLEADATAKAKVLACVGKANLSWFRFLSEK